MGWISRVWGRWLVGLLLLVAVVVIWVASSELIQFVFRDLDFAKPFFVTYFSTALFGIYLILTGAKKAADFVVTASYPSRLAVELRVARALKRWLQGAPLWIWINADFALRLLEEEEECLTLSETLRGFSRNRLRADAAKSGGDLQRRLSTNETFVLAAWFCPQWFAANYFFSLSLEYTSVSSNTILSSTSSLFTLLLGVLLLRNRLYLWDTLAVALCIGGVAIVGLSDRSSGGSDTVGGNLAALFSALAYGCYAVFLSRNMREVRVSMTEFFGWVGLINILCLWPIAIVLHFGGFEAIAVPSWAVVGSLVLNGLVSTVLSDFLWAYAVLLTSPLVATLALSLTVPLAMIADFFIHSTIASPFYALGGFVVVLGFVMANVRSQRWMGWERTVFGPAERAIKKAARSAYRRAWRQRRRPRSVGRHRRTR